MNPMHPEGIETITAEEKLREELLQTYEEYCQLLLEIVNHLTPSPNAEYSGSDLPVADLSKARDYVPCKGSQHFKHETGDFDLNSPPRF